MLGRSLHADPIFQWSFGGNASPHSIAEFTQRIYAQPAELGMVWDGGNGRGVAVWVPPGGYVVAAAVDPAVPDQSSDPQMPNAATAWTWIESFVPEETWYLEVLGVDPDAQGAGLGSALVRHGLAFAAADGADAFLETSVNHNVPYYERFGFEVVDEADMPGEGPHVWFMRAKP